MAACVATRGLRLPPTISSRGPASIIGSYSPRPLSQSQTEAHCNRQCRCLGTTGAAATSVTNPTQATPHHLPSRPFADPSATAIHPTLGTRGRRYPRAFSTSCFTSSRGSAIFKSPSSINPSSSTTRTTTPTPPEASRRYTTTITTTTTTKMASPKVQQHNIDADAVLSSQKYPAKQHARNVVEYIRKNHPQTLSSQGGGLIYIEGRADALLEDSDEPHPFRQRRAFMYLTGASELADASYIYDIASDTSTLFIPPVDPEHVVWAGLPLSPEQAKEKYDVDNVLPSTELNPTLARLGKEMGNDGIVFAMDGRVAEGVTFLEFGNKNMTVLAEAIDEVRVIKDDYEVALIVKANQISGAAHRRVLERVSKAKNEWELEGVFIGECMMQGAKKQAYPSIVASGRDAATLHYVHNNKSLEGRGEKGQLLLLDAGCEWETYASDITRTFPISGKFTPLARSIYDIVLKMQLDTIAMLKEGVSWDEVHLLAHKVAIDGLLALGVLKGDPAEILANRTSAAFLPHGLGHYLGMDTHDTGGHPNYEDSDPLFKFLRVRRNLPAGSVVTVEPGIYFCEFIIRPYLDDLKHKQFIDETVLNKYWDVGGVRIEDNILITKDGSVNLTDAVKDAEEMERIISGSN